MKTSRKWRITGTVLLIAGLIVCGASAALFGFDFSALNTSVFVTNEYEISGSFRDVSVRGSTETVLFEKSADGKCRVVCFEDEKQPHAVGTESGVLTVARETNRGSFFTFSPASPRITVYLPEEEYGRLVVELSTGDVSVPAPFRFESMEIRLSTGDVRLSATAENSVSIRTSTGDVRFDGCDAPEITVQTSTGDVTGTILTEKTFAVRTSTGHTEVPAGGTGGKCEITTSTGDIRISVLQETAQP